MILDLEVYREIARRCCRSTEVCHAITDLVDEVVRLRADLEPIPECVRRTWKRLKDEGVELL